MDNNRKKFREVPFNEKRFCSVYLERNEWEEARNEREKWQYFYMLAMARDEPYENNFATPHGYLFNVTYGLYKAATEHFPPFLMEIVQSAWTHKYEVLYIHG